MALHSYDSAALFGLVLGCSGLLFALIGSIWYWSVRRDRLHLAYAVAVGGWLVTLLGRSAGIIFQSEPLVLFLSHGACQIATAALLFFFLISASVIRFETHVVWVIQTISGLFLLAWISWSPLLRTGAYTLLVAVNMVCTVVLLSHGALRVYMLDPHQKRQWLALGGSALGLGICSADFIAFGLPDQASSLGHHLYAVFLVVLGLSIFIRPLESPPSVWVDTGAQSTAWTPVAGLELQGDSVACAIASERRRIAQELHDGVCSQLVSILATLDSRLPQQHSLVMALEQCLVDLKIAVDVIDGADDSVIDALANLRYRVQRGLDVLGIEMRWAVDAYGPLQNLHGETAKDVLRIAQECLSNVMRHSHATAVEVICAHVTIDNLLLLEIRDNGSGIPHLEADFSGGKGLDNMKKRARRLRGHLKISTKSGEGTRVRLIVPLDAAKSPVHSTSCIDSFDAGVLR